MNTAAATDHIRQQLARMDALYARPLFDEWALLGLGASGDATLHAYVGPREATFKTELPADTIALRTAQALRNYEIGDFEFALNAAGLAIDAFLRVGPAHYLVTNHTPGTMDDVRRDPRWKQAQVVWVQLGDTFRADPLRA
jgi:hypothetical protein